MILIEKRFDNILWNLFFFLILISLTFITLSMFSTNTSAQNNTILIIDLNTLNNINGINMLPDKNNDISLNNIYTIPSNISISISKDYYYIHEPVLITILNTGIWVDDNAYLEISLIGNSEYSLKYLGSINDPIIFIPQLPGDYVIRLLLGGVDISLISQVHFTVGNDFIENQLSSTNSTSLQYINSQSSYSSDFNQTDTIVGNDTKISFVKYSKFKGATTDFQKYYNNVSRLRKMSDVVVEAPGVGSIKWHNTLDVLDADIDANIQILPGKIVVNSESLDSSFNSSATLTMQNVYYTFPIILKNDMSCVNCTLLSYVNNTLTFDVSGFSNYSIVENTSLMIWDNNEENNSLYHGNMTRFANQNIEFFANYTNQSDNSSVNDADCLITLSNNMSQSFSMIYNNTSGLYVYIANFTTNGTYNYNITCNQTAFYTLNVSDDLFINQVGDLGIGNGDITFSKEYPLENENIILYVMIHSLIDYNYTDILVRFYDGDPDDVGVQIGTNVFVNISGIQNVKVNTTWNVPVGAHQIFVKIDPLNNINETDKTNNKANNNTFVSVWQTYYGNVTILTQLGASSNDTNNIFLNWSAQYYPKANVYVASPGSSINWLALQALARNSTGEATDDTLNDFAELDLSLGIENFTDSVNNTYSSSGLPLRLSNYILFYRNVTNVPEAQSTNNTNFYTGILWDTSDTMFSYYQYESNPSLRIDVVFVTRLNYNMAGAYGNYDYELSVPAFLRNYKGVGETVQLYYEVQ